MDARPIGAHPNSGGCSFRVWAPNASDVTVLVQDAPAWNAGNDRDELPLARSADGYWDGTVAEVKAGDLYRYRITNNGETFERLDPAAHDVLHSGLTRHMPTSENASIVVSDEPFPYASFTTPAFHNFIIYQLHVGAFAGRNDEFRTWIGRFENIESKLAYIREMGFNCVQFLPIQEFALDRSWGYNPAAFFAPESAYGSPDQLKHLVDSAHRQGLAVIFDVVYNHAGPGDNILWDYDGYHDPSTFDEGGIYFEGGQMTHWGRGPAWQRREVQDFFYQNAQMYFEDYDADGLRLDATRYINGNYLRGVLSKLQEKYPGKYMIAEHLPADPWITTQGNFDAAWYARAHHEMQRALNGENPVGKLKSVLGWDRFEHPWNLVKYVLGSHDDCGDQEDGDAEHGMIDWDKRHRYFIDLFGGRDDWTARAKCRLAWALNATMPGTPMLFMGSECHMGAPYVGWGYFHDGPDRNGDHRFDWEIAGDPLGMSMRALVRAANELRWQNPALRSDTLIVPHEDYDNSILAFKRYDDENAILTIVNMSDRSFEGYGYGVDTGGQRGQWTQVLCTQDSSFGGWDGAGNGFHEPWTQQDGRIYVNVPKWSVTAFRLK
jgi:1,4-alpha-glucan branching enzyme